MLAVMFVFSPRPVAGIVAQPAIIHVETKCEHARHSSEATYSSTRVTKVSKARPHEKS